MENRYNRVSYGITLAIVWMKQAHNSMQGRARGRLKAAQGRLGKVGLEEL